MSENKKTTRSFQCRDALWERFEQIARELECSVDYLINDAMKLYARQRASGSVSPSASSSGQQQAASPGAARVPPSVPPPPPGTGPRRGAFPSAATPVPGPRSPAASSLAGGPQLAPPPPPAGRLGPPGASRSPAIPSQVVPPAPRAPSRVAPPPPSRSAGPPQLCIFFEGERFVVNKDRFVIGRGRQSSDLTIKDPNVSRQHAMIERVNGQYYIVDMGSTNGVEYAGQRVQRRQINNGDVFRVCDHDLRFSFT